MELTVREDRWGGTGAEVQALTAEPAAGSDFSVVYVHGYGFDAVASLPVAWYVGEAGGRTLLVSQPGFGGSAGPPDYCGPKTLRAVAEAAERFAGGGRVGLWGFSRGAIVTGQLLRRRPDLFAAGVLQSGGYDLQRDHDLSGDESFKRNVMLETRGEPDALRERSLLYHVGEVRSPVLVIHGDRDPTYRLANAERLVEALAAAGVAHRFQVLPGEHELPWAAVAAVAVPFIREQLTVEKGS